MYTGQKRAVMGWPPVRSYRRKTIEMNTKFVKVAADGAPYLRKLDLEMFNGYQQLFIAFEQLFTSFPIRCESHIIHILFFVLLLIFLII